VTGYALQAAGDFRGADASLSCHRRSSSSSFSQRRRTRLWD
jgi:hypothetical protein